MMPGRERENDGEERESSKGTTMVRECEEEEDDDRDASDFAIGEGIEGQSIVVGGASANDDNGGNSEAAPGNRPPTNRGDAPPKEPMEGPERLRQMAALASSTRRAPNNTTSSPRSLPSAAYLPLPPREDTSPLSLALAPAAHLLSCAFLLARAGCSAALAVLDVVWNDDDAQCGAKACLGEAARVCGGCCNYAFAGARSDDANRASTGQTSAVASFYAVRCVMARAAGRSRHAGECEDAVAGALRYLMYAIRSARAVWTRASDSSRRYFQNRGQKKLGTAGDERGGPRLWKDRLNPLWAVSCIERTVSHRLRK